MTFASLPICACGCGEQLPPPPATGRPRRFVNDAHRKRAARSRGGGGTWGGAPASSTLGADPETRQRQALQKLADFLAGRPPAPAEAQLTAILIEATQLVFVLRTITPKLHHELAPRAAVLARGIDDALRSSFAEVL